MSKKIKVTKKARLAQPEGNLKGKQNPHAAVMAESLLHSSSSFLSSFHLWCPRRVSLTHGRRFLVLATKTSLKLAPEDPRHTSEGHKRWPFFLGSPEEFQSAWKTLGIVGRPVCWRKRTGVHFYVKVENFTSWRKQLAVWPRWPVSIPQCKKIIYLIVNVWRLPKVLFPSSNIE